MVLGCSPKHAVLFTVLGLVDCRHLKPGTGAEHLAASQVQLRGRGAASRSLGRQVLPTIDKWDYSDQGQSWYQIGQCGEGVGQSPINISEASSQPNSGNFFYYRMHDYTAPVEMVNTEHGLEATLGEDTGDVAVGTIFPSRVTQQFKLKSLDFHSPSEHTYRGTRVPVELQLKFEGQDDAKLGKQIAVVAIGFYGSFQRSSHTLESLRQGGLPARPGDKTMVNGRQPAAISFKELFGPLGSNDVGFWSYEGSLTSPPCTGGVTWFVRDDALPSHSDALKEFKDAIIAGSDMNQDTPGNARELQGGLNRVVTWLSAVDAMSMQSLKVVNASFDKLAQEAADAQAAADAALSGSGADTTVAPSGTTAAPATTAVLSPSDPYQVCMANLDRIYKEMNAAENQRLLECQGQVQAQAAMDAATAGQKAQAAKVLNGQKTMCSDATVVATALEAQAANQKQQCDSLAPSTAGR